MFCLKGAISFILNKSKIEFQNRLCCLIGFQTYKLYRVIRKTYLVHICEFSNFSFENHQIWWKILILLKLEIEKIDYCCLFTESKNIWFRALCSFIPYVEAILGCRFGQPISLKQSAADFEFSYHNQIKVATLLLACKTVWLQKFCNNKSLWYIFMQFIWIKRFVEDRKRITGVG